MGVKLPTSSTKFENTPRIGKRTFEIVLRVFFKHRHRKLDINQNEVKDSKCRA